MNPPQPTQPAQKRQKLPQLTLKRLNQNILTTCHVEERLRLAKEAWAKMNEQEAKKHAASLTTSDEKKIDEILLDFMITFRPKRKKQSVSSAPSFAPPDVAEETSKAAVGNGDELMPSPQENEAEASNLEILEGENKESSPLLSAPLFPPPVVDEETSNSKATGGKGDESTSPLQENEAEASNLDFYIEEIAYLKHDPPMRPPKTQIKALKEEQEYLKTQYEKWENEWVEPASLKSIPPPLPLPPLPSMSECRWTLDKDKRVYVVDFCEAHPHNDDLDFVLQLMERDDVTLISEGLLDSGMDITIDGIVNEFRTSFYHKFKRFERRHDGTMEERGEGFLSMKMEDFQSYLSMRSKCLENLNELKGFKFVDNAGITHSIADVTTTSLYLLDLYMPRYTHRMFDEFKLEFKLSSCLPGGRHCMTSSLPEDSRRALGPNAYISAPDAYTHFHRDGHGTVDSGHFVVSGYNEVVILRRLTWRHTQHAMKLLGYPPASLEKEPHDDQGDQQMPSWPSSHQIQQCAEMGYCPTTIIVKPGQLIHINKGRLHAFRKMSVRNLPEDDCHYQLRKDLIAEKEMQSEELCVSIAWDWMYRGKTPARIHREVMASLEASVLNRKAIRVSLGNPRLILLMMAKEALKSSSAEDVQTCRAILGPLKYLVATEIADMPGDSLVPDACLGDSIVNPYDDDKFECKFCFVELANFYLQCEGCRVLLDKEFNCCRRCFDLEMHLRCDVVAPMHSDPHLAIREDCFLNHFVPKRKSHVAKAHKNKEHCRNGNLCVPWGIGKDFGCGKCTLCECECHKKFILRARFFSKQQLATLLEDVASKAQEGGDELPYSNHAAARLEWTSGSHGHNVVL
jgi:hypothetical protein